MMTTRQHFLNYVKGRGYTRTQINDAWKLYQTAPDYYEKEGWPVLFRDFERAETEFKDRDRFEGMSATFKRQQILKEMSGHPKWYPKKNPRSGPAGVHEVRELILWADNTGRLHNQFVSIIKNIKRKLKRGVYDPGKAVKLWQYWMDAAAKDYVREFSGPGQRIDSIFNLATRRAAAAEVAEREIANIRSGEYDSLPNPRARKMRRKASPAQLAARAKFAAMARARAGKHRRRKNVGHAAGVAAGHKLLMARANPRAAGFAVIIRKGGTGARMQFVGGSPPSFSGTGTPKLFRSEAAARRFAHSIAGRYPVLGGYHFFAERHSRP